MPCAGVCQAVHPSSSLYRSFFLPLLSFVVCVHSAFGPNVKEPLLSLSLTISLPLLLWCSPCVRKRREATLSHSVIWIHSFPHDVCLSTLSLYNDCPCRFMLTIIAEREVHVSSTTSAVIHLCHFPFLCLCGSYVMFLMVCFRFSCLSR